MKKYFSFDQIKESLRHLEEHNTFFGITFLVAKLNQLPTGKTKKLHLDAETDAFLKKHYRLNPSSQWFFRVFRQNNLSSDWLRPDYAGKGLQSINTRSFHSAFIHTHNSHDWGWTPEYVSALSQKLPRKKKISLFDLAVWLNRYQPLSEEVTRADIIKRFISEYFITSKEREVLFDDSISSQLGEDQAFSETPVAWSKIQEEYSAPIDHFLPKSLCPELAYEWSNFRLCRSQLNHRKDDSLDVVDPFYINSDWFQLDFFTLRIEANPVATKTIRDRIRDTLIRLGLNDDGYVKERIAILKQYVIYGVPLSKVEKKYPFIAHEIRRTDFDNKHKPTFARAFRHSGP